MRKRNNFFPHVWTISGIFPIKWGEVSRLRRRSAVFQDAGGKFFTFFPFSIGKWSELGSGFPNRLDRKNGCSFSVLPSLSVVFDESVNLEFFPWIFYSLSFSHREFNLLFLWEMPSAIAFSFFVCLQLLSHTLDVGDVVLFLADNKCSLAHTANLFIWTTNGFLFDLNLFLCASWVENWLNKFIYSLIELFNLLIESLLRRSIVFYWTSFVQFEPWYILTTGSLLYLLSALNSGWIDKLGRQRLLVYGD